MFKAIEKFGLKAANLVDDSVEFIVGGVTGGIVVSSKFLKSRWDEPNEKVLYI